MVLLTLIKSLLVLNLSLNPLKLSKAGFMRNKRGEEYISLEQYSDLKLRMEKKQAVGKEKKIPTYMVGPVISQKASLQTYKPFFARYARKYSVDEEVLLKIGRCESSFNPRAVSGPYGGMFQFLTSTWVSNRRAMGLDANPDLRFNAQEAIRTTAYKISRDGTGAWPVCGQIN